MSHKERFVDAMKVIFPAIWVVVCIAAVIAYAVRERVAPAVLAALSGVVGLLLFINVLTFHTRAKYRMLAIKGEKEYQLTRRNYVIQFLVSIVLMILFGIATILLFVLDQEMLAGSTGLSGPADGIWAIMGFLSALGWFISLIIMIRRNNLIEMDGDKNRDEEMSNAELPRSAKQVDEDDLDSAPSSASDRTREPKSFVDVQLEVSGEDRH
eukprot:TRINITY_DN13937_c0_g1_i1.p1 TRINITY_DN13937_c0_g1~~TRINITY_DN13937_c0_g1_i1.p1  ORF type:complete len:211 (+),score=47.16 TRINITY_DN13937_c0_g1_i1:68-700(+)